MSGKLELFLKKNNIEVLSRKEIGKEIGGLRVFNSLEYLDVVCNIHKEFLKEEDKIKFKFRNELWRQVQIFKLWLSRAEKLDKGNKLINISLDASKKSLDRIYSINYKDLIRRAMDREEVCVGRVYYDLKDLNVKVFIRNTEDIKFNMIEEDYYNYLKKIRGKDGYELKDLILYAIEKEDLDLKSYIYIDSLIKYPNNSMKYLQNNYIKDLEIDSSYLEKLLIKDYLIN